LLKNQLMKTILLLIFISFYVGLTSTASAQVSAYNTSASGVCDGYAFLQDTINVSQTSVYWATGGAVIQQGGFYVSGLCAGTYTVSYADSSSTTQTVTFVISSGTGDPCAGFQVFIGTDSNTDTVNCNGTAFALLSGGTAPYTYSWNPSASGTATSLTGLCSGLYTCVVTDANGCAYTAQGNVTDSLGNSDPCAGFYAVLSVTPSTDSLNCNGSAIATSYGGTAPYSYSWNGPSGSTAATLTNICAGLYTCTVVDANGCSSYIQGYVTDSTQNSNPCAGFYAVANVYPASDSISCDGLITISASGGTQPYTYTLASGQSSTGTFSDLCTGTYVITVSDANGCYYSVAGTVLDSSLYFSDSTNIIDNPTFGDSTITDTLDYSWIYDCAYDLGSVDSASVMDSYVSGVDSVYVTWLLIDSTGVTLGTYTVGYATGGASGVVTVFLTVICPQHSPGSNALWASDQIYLSEGPLGMNEVSSDELRVVNPFHETLELSFDVAADRSISLFDLSGKSLLTVNANSKEVSLNTANLSKGMYVLLIHQDGQYISRKVLK
jgi:hypothetical protein